MGLFSFLKTSEKAVNTASDLAIMGAKGIDALFFTAEEKSEASLKAINLWIRTQQAIRDENSARSITRRFLACGILGTFLGMAIFAVGIYRVDPEWSAYILQVMKHLSFMTGAVTVFYFGYYGFKQIVGGKKNG